MHQNSKHWSKLKHDRCMGLEGIRDRSTCDAIVLVEPEIADTHLAGRSLDVHFLEGGSDSLSDGRTVPEDDSSRAIRKRATPDLNELLSRLNSETKIERAESLIITVILPDLVLTAIAGPSFNNRADVVPDINAKIAVESRSDLSAVGVLNFPFLVLGFLAVALVAQMALEDAELDRLMRAILDIQALGHVSCADGAIRPKSPLLAVLSSALLNNNIRILATERFTGDLASLYTQRILVDSNNFIIHENVTGVLRHLCDVATDDKRCLGKSPEREMCAVFISGHAAVANLQHVGIVPATRTSIISPEIVLIDDASHAVPVVTNVSGGTPAVADGLGPLGRIVNTPFTHGEEDGSACLVQSITHRRIALLRLRSSVVAVIIFEIVNTPLSVCLSINSFIAQRTWSALACVGSSIRIQTKLQTLGMCIVHKRLDAVGEAGIDNNLAVLCTARLPAVIKIDVVVACLGKTGAHKGINGLADKLLVDVAGKLVPAVPTHLGSATQTIVQATHNSSNTQNKK